MPEIVFRVSREGAIGETETAGLRTIVTKTGKAERRQRLRWLGFA